jgi:predicted transcriptional regulator
MDVAVFLQAHRFKNGLKPPINGETMSSPRCGEKVEPKHKPGVPSSQDEPLAGVKPDKVVCPECGKYFSSKSQMERHRETDHHHES